MDGSVDVEGLRGLVEAPCAYIYFVYMSTAFPGTNFPSL